jgi:glycosyltransferase involved in cell wall biosynthesis
MKVLAISDMHSNLMKWIESGGISSGLPALSKFPEMMIQRGNEYHWLVLDSARVTWEKHSFEKGARNQYQFDNNSILLPGRTGDKEILVRGVRVHLVGLPTQRLFKVLLKPSFANSKLYGLLYVIYGLWYSISLIRRINPDVIYGQSHLISAIASRLTRRHCIIRLYGTFLYPYLYPKYRRISQLGQIFGFKVGVDGYVITNDGSRGDEVAEALHVSQEKIHFWLNGVKKEWAYKPSDRSIYRKELNLPAEDPIILTISRLESWKRVDRVVMALRNVIQEIPNARLVVVGEGAQFNFLKELARKYAIEDNIIFVGEIPHEQIWHYLYATNLFISVNELTNLVNPLLEAMICGRCVISLADGSLRHIIENGLNGILLAEEGIESSLSIRIIDCLNNPSATDKIGKSAQEYAINNYWDWNERLKVECELLENLVN